MRLLGVSDIHGNVEAVRKLREHEGNTFDAVVVAGDIGGEAAAEIMGLLASFACPVLYVYGNWDRRLPYDADFGPSCHHLHLRPVECGGWTFAGISGIPRSWGLNPIAAELLGAGRETEREVLLQNKLALAAAIGKSTADLRRTVVVAHDRLFGIDRDFPGLALHLFGHRHGFKFTTRKDTTFVNVSALDDPAKGDRYTIIQIEGDRMAAKSLKLI